MLEKIKADLLAIKAKKEELKSTKDQAFNLYGEVKKQMETLEKKIAEVQKQEEQVLEEERKLLIIQEYVKGAIL